MTVQDAEKQFLQKPFFNCRKYNIDINKAAIKQAKIWDNPDLSFLPAISTMEINIHSIMQKAITADSLMFLGRNCLKVAKQRKNSPIYSPITP